MILFAAFFFNFTFSNDPIAEYAATEMGQGEFMAIPNPVSKDFCIAFEFTTSIECKIRDDNNDHWFDGCGMVDGDIAYPQNDFGITLGRHGEVFFGVGNPDTSIKSAPGFADGSRHRVCATREMATGKIVLFIDDGLVGVAYGQIGELDASPMLELGNTQNHPGYEYEGTLKNVKFWDEFDCCVPEDYKCQDATPTPAGTPSIDGYAWSHNGYWAGFQQVTDSATNADCAAQCDSYSPECFGFSRNTINNKCYVYTNEHDVKGMHNPGNAGAGIFPDDAYMKCKIIPDNGASPANPNTQYNTVAYCPAGWTQGGDVDEDNYISGPIYIIAKSVEDNIVRCATICESTRACTSFSYVGGSNYHSEGGSCLLYKRETPMNSYGDNTRFCYKTTVLPECNGCGARERECWELCGESEGYCNACNNGNLGQGACCRSDLNAGANSVCATRVHENWFLGPGYHQCVILD